MSESADIIAAANEPDAITDEKGRCLEVLRLTGSKLSRFLLLTGPAGDNALWLGASLARVSVRSIDGRPMPPLPTKMDQIHALWDIVDDVAASAVITHWSAEGEEKNKADAKK